MKDAILPGEELFRVPEGTDVWFSKRPGPSGSGIVVTVHVNPSPDRIKPDWFRAGERF